MHGDFLDVPAGAATHTRTLGARVLHFKSLATSPGDREAWAAGTGRVAVAMADAVQSHHAQSLAVDG